MKPRQQSGFALITAIIILVVLAALGAFAASFVPMQQLGSAADIQGARVLLAARSGLEWGGLPGHARRAVVCGLHVQHLCGHRGLFERDHRHGDLRQRQGAAVQNHGNRLQSALGRGLPQYHVAQRQLR